MGLKILQICPRWPHPPDSGGKVLMFETARELMARGHRVTVLAPDLSPRRLLLWPRYASMLPYTVAKYYDPAMLVALDRLLSSETFDLVQIEFSHMAYCASFIKQRFKLPVLLRLHNIQSVLMKRYSQSLANPLMKLITAVESARLRHYEARMCGSVDACLALSDVDAVALHRLAPKVRIEVVPPGVDIEQIKPDTEAPDTNTILFVGPLDWAPNAQGVDWFLREVLPLVRRQVPSVKVLVVGAKPSRRLLRWATDRVQFTGLVPDVRCYLSRATVVVVPLQVGSGVRLKILHALAAGKAVVSTSIGAEGLDVKHLQEIWLADSAPAFAQGIVELLRDPSLRAKLGNAGRQLVVDKCSWTQAIERLERAYAAVR